MSDRKDKKAQFAQPKKKNMLPVVVVAALAISGLGLIAWNALGGGETGRVVTVSANQGQNANPVSEVFEGHAKFMPYQTETPAVEVLGLK